MCQNGRVMKEQLLKIALEILHKIVADLIDDGKLNNSAKQSENPKN